MGCSQRLRCGYESRLEGLSRACGETVVVLGEGGNTELACIPADIVLFAAELVVGAAQAIVDHIAVCDRIFDLIEANPQATAAETIRQLHQAVVAFGAGTPQADDLTVIAVKRL